MKHHLFTKLMMLHGCCEGGVFPFSSTSLKKWITGREPEFPSYCDIWLFISCRYPIFKMKKYFKRRACQKKEGWSVVSSRKKRRRVVFFFLFFSEQTLEGRGDTKRKTPSAVCYQFWSTVCLWPSHDHLAWIQKAVSSMCLNGVPLFVGNFSTLGSEVKPCVVISLSFKLGLEKYLYNFCSVGDNSVARSFSERPGFLKTPTTNGACN